MFEIQVNILRAKERHSNLFLFARQLPGATVAAVNDTLVELREQAVSALTGVVNAPQDQIDSRVLVQPASRTSLYIASGSISLSRKSIPLKYFSPKQTASGVAYSPTVGTHKTIKGAFGPNIARLGNGVFRRTGKSRKPIEKVKRGFSMARSRPVAAVINRILAQAGPMLEHNVDKRVNEFMTNLQSGRMTFGPTYVNRVQSTSVRFGRAQSIVTRR